MCVVLVILGFTMLWTGCTTPSPPPYKWDPSILNGIPGMYGPTPTPLPSQSWYLYP